MGEDFFIGTIIPIPYTFVPADTVKCNGQLLSIQQYQALYALVGNTFGGNPNQNFAVPNLQGFEPHPKVYYVMTTTGLWPQRP